MTLAAKSAANVGDAHLVSGAPHFKTTSSGKKLSWHRAETTVYFDSSLENLGEFAEQAVQDAFGEWLAQNADMPKLKFDHVKNLKAAARDGKNTVSVAPIEIAGHTQDLAVTVAYSDDTTGEIVEADLIFNSRYPYGLLNATAEDTRSKKTGQEESFDCEQRFDIQNVATHEVGHFLGLGEDYDNERATMYRTTERCETHKRRLAETDQQAISVLYPAVSVDGQAPADGLNENTVKAAGCGRSQISAGAATPSDAVLVLGALSALGIAVGRRRK